MLNFDGWYFKLKWWQRGLYAMIATSAAMGIWYLVDGEFMIVPIVAASTAAMLPLK